VQRSERLIGERGARLAPDHRADHAPVDDEGGAQLRPVHPSLRDELHHLMAGPHVVSAGLHRNEHQVGGQQRGAREGRDAGRTIDHHEIRMQGDLRRFLVQRVPRQPEDAAEPFLATLKAPLRPVQG
jgi:hypothetical protein